MKKIPNLFVRDAEGRLTEERRQKDLGLERRP